MKLTLHRFRSNVPREKICQPGVEYDELVHTHVGPIQALAFLDKLTFPRDSFYLEVSDYLVEFWKHERSIWVEISGSDFWATSEVSLGDVKAIIDSLGRGERFSNEIPTTNREWDAHTPAPEK
ncbi:MAG TPA: hypothetical protein VEZ90_19335 [Blastocatellia bacterium]|nr:hypothetical protein [Blastocatellia bacterium]